MHFVDEESADRFSSQWVLDIARLRGQTSYNLNVENRGCKCLLKRSDTDLTTDDTELISCSF